MENGEENRFDPCLTQEWFLYFGPTRLCAKGPSEAVLATKAKRTGPPDKVKKEVSEYVFEAATKMHI